MYWTHWSLCSAVGCTAFRGSAAADSGIFLSAFCWDLRGVTPHTVTTQLGPHRHVMKSVPLRSFIPARPNEALTLSVP